MKLQKFDHWWWVLTTTSFKHILISFKLSIYSSTQHIDDTFKGNTSYNEFFLTRNHLLTQWHLHKNYGISVIDRTHSFAHEIIIIVLLMWCYCCTYLQLFVKSKTNLLEHCWRVERGHLHMHFVGSQTLPDSWQARTSERSRHWQPHNSSRYT